MCGWGGFGSSTWIRVSRSGAPVQVQRFVGILSGNKDRTRRSTSGALPLFAARQRVYGLLHIVVHSDIKREAGMGIETGT